MNPTVRSAASGRDIIDFPVILMFTASGILLLAYAYISYKIHVVALIVAMFASLTGIVCLIALRSRYMDLYYIPFAIFHIILFTIVAGKTTHYLYQVLKKLRDEDPNDSIAPELENNPMDIFEMAEGR